MAAELPRVLTPKELSEYSGKGKLVYVALEGIVYDLSDSTLWEGGMHFGHMAGADLTGEIKDAPHGKEVFEPYPSVGKLE